jgi:hypothetical protein
MVQPIERMCLILLMNYNFQNFWGQELLRAVFKNLCKPHVSPLGVRRGGSLWDAVPNEVRDARLALGRTKKDDRQDGVGGTF